MAVIVKYIVVRNGDEKMTFATKKEADAYDKMLDIADNLFDFLEKAKLKVDENQLEEISLLLAENKDALIPILKGLKPKAKPAKKPVKASAETPENTPEKKAGEPMETIEALSKKAKAKK
ncbi:MAG: YebG family protein [Pseudomonadota bacterium]